MIIIGRCQPRLQQTGAHAAGIGAERRGEKHPDVGSLARLQRLISEFAVVLSHANRNRRRSGAYADERRGCERAAPVLLPLIDLQQQLEYRMAAGDPGLEVGQDRLGPIQDPQFEIVLGQFEERLFPLCGGQARSRNEILVDADSTIHFAAPAKQCPQRQMCLKGIVVDRRKVEEHLDCLVRLLAQEIVHPAQIVFGKSVWRTGQWMTMSALADQPSGPCCEG